MKINRALNRNFYFYFFDLSDAIEPIEFNRYYIGKANIVDFIRSYLFENPELNIAQCIKRRDEYFIIRHRNKILSLGRICYKNTKEVVLDSREASLISFFTRDEYRRQGMYTALINKMMIYLKKRHFKLCIIWADEKNIPSRWAIEKLGFKRIYQ